MPNIPGINGYYTPDVLSRVRTLQRALSIPGGLRILSIIGEGRREETVIESAEGDGTDGFNPTFTGVSDGYGRFFRLENYPIVSNRTTLLLNDSPLRLLESTIDGNSFPVEYDARIEIETGKIEMQKASLKDQGGKLYSASAGNVGDGYLSTLTLSDENAPSEIWTIRCTSVLKDGTGAPIRGTATFIARGSESGQLFDSYGQAFTWKSDEVTVDNTVLSFAIYNPSPGQPFIVGDKFTIEVESRVLQSRDNLQARYIAEIDINDPKTFSDPSKLFSTYGTPSIENTLSLAAQMAFENGATAILALQAKPPLPRRTSEIALPAYNSITGQGGATGNDDPDDLIFYIDAPGKPDSDTTVLLFVINQDGSEDQIFPNKVTFYDPDITSAFSAYEQTGIDTLLQSEFMDPAQSGKPYSYTIVSDDKIEQGSTDGYIGYITGLGKTANFHSLSANFTSLDVSDNKVIDIYGVSSANEGRWEITEIVDQNTVKIARVSGSFESATGLKWQLILPGSESQRLLFTSDLALAQKKGLRISYIDNKDADFFDANWFEALDVLESQDLQILTSFPTQTFSAIQQACRVHCERMSTTFYKRERVFLTGALDGLSVENVIGTELAAVEDIGILEGIQGDDPEELLADNVEDLADYSVAHNFGDTFRVMYFYPDQIVRAVNGTRTLLPGYYISAAAAGWFAGQPNAGIPLTYKILVGFTILNDKVYKQEILNLLGAAGIATVQPVTGGGRVIHGKTTTQSGEPTEEEATIIFIRDQLARAARTSLRVFVASPNSGDDTLIASITQKMISLLNSFASQNLITDYRNLSVFRDDVEPRQINIVVEVEPAIPVDWIFIDMSVGLF